MSKLISTRYWSCKWKVSLSCYLMGLILAFCYSYFYKYIFYNFFLIKVINADPRDDLSGMDVARKVWIFVFPILLICYVSVILSPHALSSNFTIS